MRDDSTHHPDGWTLGDRVEVASVLRIRRARNRPSVRATGHITGFNGTGIEVHFDHEPVNGYDWCTASSSELTRIEDFQ